MQMTRDLLAAGWIAALVAAPPALPQAGRGGRGAAPPPVKSPEVSADGRVTVRLRATSAQKVTVSGLSPMAVVLALRRL
jgi:hypothetical protein